MTDKCPICGTDHDSEECPTGWYFVCCGHARLVWLENPLRLEVVPEDLEDEDF